MNTLLEVLKTLLVILKWVVLGTAALALLVGVYLLGFRTGSGPQPAGPPPAHAEAAPDEADAVWTCSMHPQIRESKPGDCPICGMKLVPAKDASADHGAKGDNAKAQPEAKKYACSMFCVPPLPEPGKCPVCGMEMVEVSDDAPGSSSAAAPRLTVSKNARALAEIRTTPVERRFVTATIRMVGKVAFDETTRRTITAWAAGRIDRLFVDYIGVRVGKGDAMVSLYSPDLISAQEELIQALRAARELDDGAFEEMRRSALDTVEATRARLRHLGLAPEQIAAVEKAAKPSDHVVIRAPEGGIVVEKAAIEGMYVKTGTRIYTIADLSTVWVKLDAYESDLAWIRYGQKVTFETEAYPGRTFRGRITFIDPVLDGRTRTVKVRVNVPNPDGALKPDMFVRGRVRSRVAAGAKVMDPALSGKWISPRHPEVVKDGPGKCDKCGIDLVRAEDLGYVTVDPAKTPAPLVIPTSAALVTGRRAVVYVETEPGVFEGREVVLGARAGDHYLVKSGLTEGELVVVNGAFKIDSAMQIRAKPSMMSPRPGSGAEGEAAAQGEPAAPENAPAKPQTHCPVMGKPVQKHVFTDHDGMRIYFCCPPCIAKFKADPEGYLKKMRDAGVEPERTPE